MIIALQEINKGIDDATLNRITLGDLPGDLSAVALLQIEKGQGQVFLPRLANRGLLKQQGAEMFIEQTKNLGVSKVAIGTPGHKREYDVSKLEGSNDVKYKYSAKNPETDFGRASLNDALRQDLDAETRLGEILLRNDPKGDHRRKTMEEARRTSPILQKYAAVNAFAVEADMGNEDAEVEGSLLELELGVDIDGLHRGVLPDSRELGTPQAPTDERNSNEGASEFVRQPKAI